MTRPIYGPDIVLTLGEDEWKRRVRMTALVGQKGRSPEDMDWLVSQLPDMHVSAVVAPADHPQRHRLESLLQERGYEMQVEHDHLIWIVRPD